MGERAIVGFDGLQHRHPTTGSGQYAAHLWRELTRRAAGPFEFQLLDPGSARVDGNLGKLAWEQVGIVNASRRAGADLVHVPYFSAPLLQRTPLVVTIHDVIPLAMPAYARSWRVRAYLRLVGRAARRAARIITDSAYSRDDIVRHLGLPDERIRVVPLGVSDAFRPVESYADEERIERLRERFGLRRPFVLNVGGFDLRKRLDVLVEGFAIAAAALDTEYDLVIAGNPHSANPSLYPPLEPLIHALGIADRVRLLGFVSEEDKRELYRAAEVFAFTSEYEGFGLDPLEAMACGAPVICSNRTSLPEVVGDAAVLVEPEPEAVGAAMVALLSSPDLRADLALRGRRRADAFTWGRTADATIAVYCEILRTGRGHA